MTSAQFNQLITEVRALKDALRQQSAGAADLWAKPQLRPTEVWRLRTRGWCQLAEAAGWISRGQNGLYDTAQVRAAMDRKDKPPPPAKPAWKTDAVKLVRHLVCGSRSLCGLRSAMWVKPDGERPCPVCAGAARKKGVSP